MQHSCVYFEISSVFGQLSGKNLCDTVIQWICGRWKGEGGRWKVEGLRVY